MYASLLKRIEVGEDHYNLKTVDYQNKSMTDSFVFWWNYQILEEIEYIFLLPLCIPIPLTKQSKVERDTNYVVSSGLCDINIHKFAYMINVSNRLSFPINNKNNLCDFS